MEAMFYMGVILASVLITIAFSSIEWQRTENIEETAGLWQNCTLREPTPDDGGESHIMNANSKISHNIYLFWRMTQTMQILEQEIQSVFDKTIYASVRIGLYRIPLSWTSSHSI